MATMKSNIVVIGAKRSKGVMEGKPYDHTTIFTQDTLDQKTGDAFGLAGTDYRYGTSENFDKLKGTKTPFEAEATFEIITTGKATRMIIIDLKPLPAQQKV